MSSEKGNALVADEQLEPEKKVESNEKVDFDEEHDTEEEIEYEEVEEEEVVEEIEEEIEVEEEVEDDDDDIIGKGAEAHNTIEGGKKVDDIDEESIWAELLARPPHGSEVYIGGIPHDASEEDLKEFCESIGEVTLVRLMKDKDSTENKGFAFVTYRNVELASKAIDKLDNSEFKGRRIKCSTSQSKKKLFLSNIPRSWVEKDLRKVLMEVGPGVTAVELVKDIKNSSNNRGFAFIDYYNNACAEYSRQKMMNSKFKLGDNVPTVSWADPKHSDSSASSASSASSQIKIIYIKNLPKNVIQDQLKKLFEHHGKITKVVLPPAKPGQENNRIGFLHFAERSSAVKALKNTEKYEIDGQVLECSFAKPLPDHKPVGGLYTYGSNLLPSYPPNVGYGLMGGSLGDFGAGYDPTCFAQPFGYVGGAAASGLAMMPMLLPDGQIGYVLQQSGVQTQPPPPPPPYQRGSFSGVGKKTSDSSGRAKHRQDGGHGRRYHPY